MNRRGTPAFNTLYVRVSNLMGELLCLPDNALAETSPLYFSVKHTGFTDTQKCAFITLKSGKLLLFPISIFSDRRSLIIENAKKKKKNAKTFIAEVSYIALGSLEFSYMYREAYPGSLE